MDEAGPGQWLTLAEVAGRTDRHIDAVRSWAQRGRRNGRLRVRKNNRHELQVWLTPELETEFGQGDGSAASVDGLAGGEDTAQAVGELRRQVAELAQALTEARVGQARAEGELAAETRRNADLAANLEHERAGRAVLAAELAEARKPMLVRLLEALRRR